MQGLIDQLRIPVLTVLIALLAFFALTKLLGPIPFSVNSIQTTKSDLFTVTGVGEISAVPENASVSLGVTKNGTTADLAQTEVNKVLNVLLTDLKEMGVKEDKIKTENINVNPTYNFDNGSQTITGYTASQNLSIEVEDVELANQIIDTATTDGANVISGVSFTLNDEEKERLTAEARKIAIKDAKEKAKTIAGEAGITLGKVINIQVEEGDNQPIPFDARVANETLQKEETTDLQPGENKIKVTVYLSYETL